MTENEFNSEVRRDPETGLGVRFIRQWDIEPLTSHRWDDYVGVNPDAHLGAEETPYRPLVVFRRIGSNAHSGGRIMRGDNS